MVKMDMIECKKKRLTKEVKIDKNLINSLIKSSLKRLKTQELLPLNNTTSSSKISLTYEALRELLEALGISKGYKIYNHECYCAFLKEIMNESNLGNEFNKFRKTRNAINYYGKDISTDEAKHLIQEMKEFIKKVKTKFF